MSRRAQLYAELEKLPEHKVGEIIDGELIVSPRPASRHAFAASTMGADLNGAFHGAPEGPGRPGGWWIVFEPELHLGEDVLVPDVAGWRHERMPVYPDVAGFTLAPDWVCEVLSPSTARIDRSRKLRIYARERVAHVWLVDPVLRTVEIYRRHEQLWTLVASPGDDDVIRAEPFAEIEIALRRWWV